MPKQRFGFLFAINFKLNYSLIMNNDLYNMIFKRKSFHLFRNRCEDTISDTEIQEIYDAYSSFDSLYDIKTKIKIISGNEAPNYRGEDLCILMFSEKKDGYLQNIGYLGEQLDLYLVSKDIGTLWFGIAKSNEVYEGLDYVIMFKIAKMPSDKFRSDMYKSKRKAIEEIWKGNDLDIGNIVRFSPSACNSQPWFVENIDDQLYVYRKSKSGKVGIMPKNASVYYNQIDIGIFMCILELCLNNNKINYVRTLHKDNGTFDEKELNAVYSLIK